MLVITLHKSRVLCAFVYRKTLLFARCRVYVSHWKCCVLSKLFFGLENCSMLEGGVKAEGRNGVEEGQKGAKVSSSERWDTWKNYFKILLNIPEALILAIFFNPLSWKYLPRCSHRWFLRNNCSNLKPARNISFNQSFKRLEFFCFQKKR